MGESLVDRVAQWLKDKIGGEYVTGTPLFGDVRMNRTDVKNSWREGRTDTRAEAFRLAPEILRKGILLNQIHNYKGKEGVSRSIVAAPVTINGEKRYGVVVVQHDRNMQRATFHDAYAIPKVMLEGNKKAQQEFLRTGPSPEEGARLTVNAANPVEPVLTVLRRAMFVNENAASKIESATPIPDATQGSPKQNGQNRGRVYDFIVREIVQSTSSKVVDANGEPLVVYHGTDKAFDTFSTENQWGQGGAYFSDNPSAASIFAGNTGSVMAGKWCRC